MQVDLIQATETVMVPLNTLAATEVIIETNAQAPAHYPKYNYTTIYRCLVFV